MLVVSHAAGFSYSDDPADEVHDEIGVANDMLDFLQEFLDAHPDLQDNELFVTGESYAVRFPPSVWCLMDLVVPIARCMFFGGAPGSAEKRVVRDRRELRGAFFPLGTFAAEFDMCSACVSWLSQKRKAHDRLTHRPHLDSQGHYSFHCRTKAFSLFGSFNFVSGPLRPRCVAPPVAGQQTGRGAAHQLPRAGNRKR